MPPDDSGAPVRAWVAPEPQCTVWRALREVGTGCAVPLPVPVDPARHAALLRELHEGRGL